MNPILQATFNFIDAGRQITSVMVDDHIHPRNVTFEFDDGSTEGLSLEVEREEFMNWWKHTGKYFRNVARIKPLDELA